MLHFITLFLLSFSFIGLTNCFAENDTLAEKIGSLRKVSDSALVQRAADNETVKAVDGLAIYQNDIISTDHNGSLGIIFIDGTRISLGPKSKLTISKYVFNPSKSNYSMLTRIFKGTASYISGKLSRLAPDAVKFETPDATIGSRGTSFLIKVEARNDND